MKWLTPILLLSVAANLTLGALIYSRRPPANLAPADPAETRTIATQPTATDPTAPVVVNGVQLRPEDIAYVTRLRAGGMPAEIIRDLLYQRIYDRHRDRIRALLPSKKDQYWLSFDMTGFQAASPEIRTQMREIYKEMDAEIRALLGDGPEALGAYERMLRDSMASYLSNAKIQQVQAIRKDYDDLVANVRTGGRGLVLKADREQLRLLERERRADLAAVLTPEELLEYDLRASPTSINVRNRLTYFAPTEEEFRAIAKLQLAIDQQFGMSNLSGEEQDRKRAAEKQFPTQVQAVLTPERFAEFKATIDGAFSETIYFTNAYNLDRRVAVDLMTLKQQMWQRVDELDQTGLPADQRTAALKALEEEANRQLLTTLGAEVFEKYKKSSAGWLNRLKSAPSRP